MSAATLMIIVIMNITAPKDKKLRLELLMKILLNIPKERGRQLNCVKAVNYKASLSATTKMSLDENP